MKKIIVSEVHKKWSEVGNFSRENNLQIEVELYKKILDIAHVGASYYFIFNPSLGEIVYCSDEFEQVLGYPKEFMNLHFLLSKIHPNDFERFVEFETAVVDFKKELPIEKKMKYKTRYSYRMKKSNGQYINIIQQSVTISLNKQGGLQHNLIFHTDITEFSPSNEMKLSFIGLEGEPSYIDVQPKYLYKRENIFYSPKEKEVLLLMIKGMKSEEIAKTLNRSIHTINVHRKNILSKSGCKTFSELIAKTVKEGLAN